jgi:hypothetical protein
VLIQKERILYVVLQRFPQLKRGCVHRQTDGGDKTDQSESFMATHRQSPSRLLSKLVGCCCWWKGDQLVALRGKRPERVAWLQVVGQVWILRISIAKGRSTCTERGKSAEVWLMPRVQVLLTT